MARLANKNILITGGNSGIGLAAAQEFDREGARVAICGLNEASLQAAKETLGLDAPFMRAVYTGSMGNLTRLTVWGERLIEAPYVNSVLYAAYPLERNP